MRLSSKSPHFSDSYELSRRKQRVPNLGGPDPCPALPMGILCSRSAAHVWPSPEPVKSLCTLNSFQIIPALCRNWTSNLHQPQLFYNFLEEYHSKGLLFSPLPPAVCLILLQLKFMYLPKGVYSHPSLPCTQCGGVRGEFLAPDSPSLCDSISVLTYRSSQICRGGFKFGAGST